MPKAEPKVEAIPGERFSFRVRSDQDASLTYQANLDDYNFTGFCDCPDFRCRWEPVLSRLGQTVTGARCKHIRAARRFYVSQRAQERAQQAYDEVYRVVEEAAKKEIGEV